MKAKPTTKKSAAAAVAALPAREPRAKKPKLAEESGLPTVDSLEKDLDDSQAVRVLLVEAGRIDKRMDGDKKRMDEIKTTLSEYTTALGISGFRHMKVGFSQGEEQTKSTLDKGLLILNGVKAAVIARSYKESKPFRQTFIKLFD